MNQDSNILKLKRLGIDNQREYFVYMRSDCHICISEGFEALTRIEVTVKDLNMKNIHTWLIAENAQKLVASALKNAEP